MQEEEKKKLDLNELLGPYEVSPTIERAVVEYLAALEYGDDKEVAQAKYDQVLQDEFEKVTN